MASPPNDWHKEDIKAAIRRRGTTLKRLALDAGLWESATRVALCVPCFRAEQAIAAFIGIPAQELWPDRYDPDGTPLHPRARRQHLSRSPRGGHRQKRRRK